MYFVTSAAVGTRCILLMNTLSLHRKKVVTRGNVGQDSFDCTKRQSPATL